MALILLADDDEILCPLVEAALQAEGHEVVLAKEGREAVALMRKYTFDLVVMDYNMPVMTGVDAVRQARTEVAPFPPVIMLTVRGDAETVQECLQAGARDFIVKPFEVAELIRRIEKHLGPGA
ncbi:MAG: response regulator transcription factor [bacterium]